MGRPSSFTQDTADTICTRLAEGESLRKICRDESMPGMTAVMGWLRDNEEFAKQYARAREIQADVLAEETIDIADQKEGDYTTDPDGILVCNTDHIQRARLRVDARKWFASKVAPKKYGDKLELAGDKDRPLTVQVVELAYDGNPAPR